MLYQIKRIRLLSALKVGALGGMVLGMFAGFLAPSMLVALDIFIRFNSLGNIFSVPNALALFIQLTISLTIAGAIGGAIAGTVVMGVLGFFYNLTTRYTGGLLVELEPRGKLKEKVSHPAYDHEDERIAPPLILDDQEDVERAEPLRSSVNRL
jgi:hypothetical protein